MAFLAFVAGISLLIYTAAVAVILIRRLFKRCNNPYIPGIIAGVLLCWLQVSCNFTLHAFVYYGPMAAYLP